MKLESNKNKILYLSLIITFAVLYLATAFVSWYHSITFFNISNEVWLSVLLSFVCEVGQASVLFAILLTKNKNRLLPWAIMIILTLLQVIGNVVSSYKFIQTSNTQDFTYFKDSILFWVETTEGSMFKIIIAWITGGILPVVALSMTALVAENLHHAEEEIKANEKSVEEKVASTEEKKEEPLNDNNVDNNSLVAVVEENEPNEKADGNNMDKLLKEKEDLITMLKDQLEKQKQQEQIKQKEETKSEFVFNNDDFQHSLEDYYLADVEIDEMLEKEEQETMLLEEQKEEEVQQVVEPENKEEPIEEPKKKKPRVKVVEKKPKKEEKKEPIKKPIKKPIKTKKA